MLTPRRFLATHLPDPARAVVRELYHGVRRWNARRRSAPGDETVDLVFVTPPDADGWILEAICHEIGARFDGTWTIVPNEPPFPKARTYFFAHYWVYLNHRRDSPHFKSADLLVWFTHPSDRVPYGEREIVRGLNESTKVLFPNARSARTLIGKGLREDRAAVVLGAADPARFQPHRRTGGGLVGFVSAFYERKNPDTVLEIVRRMPHRRFLLVGRGWRAYRRFAELAACPNFAYREPPYAEYPDAYAQMDVFVSPSLLEGGPVPLLEAMMSNVVPVASRTGFAPDLVADGENGFLFEPGAPAEAICALIERAFALETDVRATVERYDWDRFAGEVLALIPAAGNDRGAHVGSLPKEAGGRRSGFTIAWYVPKPTPQVASLRCRCFLPAAHLRALGFESVFVSRNNLAEVRGADCLVIVKYFDPWSLAAANLAQDAGIPVLLDQCENVWHPEYRGEAGKTWRKYFDALAAIASGVVTPSPYLADHARRNLPRGLPVSVIPDPVESAADWRAITALLTQAERKASGVGGGPGERSPIMRRIRGALDPLPSTLRSKARLPGKRVLWFGNHGSGHAQGMLALLRIAPILERVSRDIPLHLVVASNSRDKYLRYIEPLPVPTAYVDWDPVAIHDLIRSADLCVMPNPVDDLTLAKSSSRVTLALSHGTPVVATMLPALEPLKDCIAADDWERGIRRYLSDRRLSEAHLASAAAIIEAEYSGKAVAARWAELLRSAVPPAASSRPEAQTAAARPRLLVAVTLPQDLDVLLPVITAAQARSDLELTVTVPRDLLKESPRVYRALLAAEIVPRVVTEKEALAGALWADRTCNALLTAADSDLPAHKLGHALAKQGGARGVRTYTVQHGYENPGLTYFDRAYGGGASLASATIFTWQDLRRLKTPTPIATLNRCVAVGCPKPVETGTQALPLPPGTGPTVAVFENLHWHRYGDRYRRRFLADLRDSARGLPDWRFLVKPHHAGRWFNERRRDPTAEAGNVLVIDPTDPAWEPFTAPALIAHADAVVSTPSTVALDAARAGKPVAVAGYDLDLPLYEPLTVLRSGDDWLRFLRDSDRASLADLGRRFVERAILPGDGAARILDRIAADVLGAGKRAAVR